MASENLIFETADGLTLVMPDSVYSYETLPGNFGLPPTNYIVRQGYRQDGSTEIDYTLGEREFDLDFWRAPACDRATYWANRAELVDYFRPNRNGQLTFKVVQADGTTRALMVRAIPGFTFTAQSNNNNWNIRESINLRAFNPIWFDPTANSIAVVSSVSNDLVFPITFPIQFGASGLLFTTSITYTGTWKSYPTLTFTGPYTSVVVSNLTTGVSIFLSVAITAGESRILDLTPGSQSLVDGNGDDAFGDLGPTSNLVDFNLRPDPEVVGGIQTIEAVLYNASGAAGFTISYFDRYIGI